MEENIVYNLNRVNLDRNTNIDIHQLYEDYSINFSDEDKHLAYEMNYLYNCNVGELKKMSETIGDDFKKIEQVAAISANNDNQIGALIANAMERVSKDGVITVEEAKLSVVNLKLPD